MNRYFFFIAVFALISFAGCEQKNRQESGETEALYEEVMAVHDEVMPWMQDVNRYKRQIREKMDSPDGSVDTAGLSNLMGQLEGADKAMMDWMRNFSRKDYKEMTEEEAVSYLQDQKQKVEQVRNEMRQALENAEETL